MGVVCMATDLFSDSWHEYDLGGELPCTKALTLVDYASSRSAKAISFSAIALTGAPAVTVTITGPVCDDGMPLWTSYRLTRGAFERLDEKTRRRFIKSVEWLSAPKGPPPNFYKALDISR